VPSKLAQPSALDDIEEFVAAPDSLKEIQQENKPPSPKVRRAVGARRS
jgi:hypothetical protein